MESMLEVAEARLGDRYEAWARGWDVPEFHANDLLSQATEENYLKDIVEGIQADKLYKEDEISFMKELKEGLSNPEDCNISHTHQSLAEDFLGETDYDAFVEHWG